MRHPITLHQPARVEAGPGAAARLGEWAAPFRRVLVVASRSTARMADRLGIPAAAVHDGVPAEPDDAALAAALAAAARVKPDLVVGLGGGSVMDVAKLVAVLWDGGQTLADVAGANRVARKLSAIAQVATTAGTGSEAGIRALVTDRATGAKTAVESPLLLADVAVLDPDLTLSVPPGVTAATGVDALAHCVEAFTSLRAHPLVDGFARLGIALVGRNLAAAVADGTDSAARAQMLTASYFGGLCLGPVNTAAGHAIAYPLGTRLKLPHGLANALVFPHVLAFNAPARPERTAEILGHLGLPPSAEPAAVLDAARAWVAALGIDPRLSAHGASRADLPRFAQEAHAIRRLMDNNPRPMSVDEVRAVYDAAF